MKNKNKKTGALITVTICYLIMIGLDLVQKFIGDVSVGLLSLGVILISAIMPIVINLILKKKNELSCIWVLLSVGIIIIRFLGIMGLTIVAREFVENNMEIINRIYNSILVYVIHYLLLYATSLASVVGYKKKKPKDPYAYLDNVQPKYDLFRDIYEEYGNYDR